MKEVPNVNFFIGYVDCLKGKNSKDSYVQDNLEARRFYASGKEYDYVKYVNTGSKEKIDFVEYSGNHEKSHGIFDSRGLLNEEQTKDLRAKLRDTYSPIWHGVISFTEEFGNTYCDSYEKAQKMMSIEFPRFLKKAGLNPDNIIWFAGLHENTDNKHIHFSFFEEKPERTKQKKKGLYYSDGFIPINAINSTKVAIELRLLNISSEVAAKRKLLTEELKKQFDAGAFVRKVKSLIYLLPKTGRLQYDSENLDSIRSEIDYVAYTIIKSNKALKEKVNALDDILTKRDKEIIKAYTRNNNSYEDKLLRDKCFYDLNRRLGNIIIFFVKQIRDKQEKLDYETKNRLKLKRIEKAKRKIMLDRCMRLNDAVNREIVNTFQEYLQRLEEANYKRLQEEGYFD